MLTYDLGKRGRKTLYEYLYECIRDDILSGRIKAGQALPSKRALSRQLSVSVITVETAYEQLQTEGYIYSEPRKGFFVSRLEIPAPDPAAGPGPDTDGFSAEESSQEAETDSRAQVKEEQPVFADFSSNQMPRDAFPFATWAKLSRQVLSQRQEQLMQNPPSGGVRELRSAIANHLRGFRGISVEPDQVIIGAGTEYLYGLLVQLLGFDKIYAVENPGYSKVSQVFDAYGVRSVSIDLDSSGMRTDLLSDSPANVAHITPSDHFPTGITMPAARRYELLGWAAQADQRYIIEDDYDSELRMSGRPLPALCSTDRDGKVIYMNTFNKSLASTIRISYMVLPEKLLTEFRKKLSFYSCTVPTFEQYTLAAFISEGYFEKHINRVRNGGRHRKQLLMNAIRESSLRGAATWQEDSAGLHFLLNLKLTQPAQAFARRLSAQGIRLRPLSSYAAGRPGRGTDSEEDTRPWSFLRGFGDSKPEHTFVMNFSSVPEDKIPEAVARIARAFQGQDG